MKQEVVDAIAESLAQGPKTAEEVLKDLRKAKRIPKGDALPQVRYALALHREKFEKVPNAVGTYRLKV